jgi:hypothetical protein
MADNLSMHNKCFSFIEMESILSGFDLHFSNSMPGIPYNQKLQLSFLSCHTKEPKLAVQTQHTQVFTYHYALSVYVQWHSPNVDNLQYQQ